MTEKTEKQLDEIMELIKGFSDSPVLRKMIGNIMSAVESEGYIRGMKQGLDIYTASLNKVL